MTLSADAPSPVPANQDQADAQRLLDMARRRLSGPERFELEDIIDTGHDTGFTLARLRTEFAEYLQ